MRRKRVLILSIVLSIALIDAFAAWRIHSAQQVVARRAALADAWPSLDELRGPPLPDAQNAAIAYAQAREAVDLPWEERQLLFNATTAAEVAPLIEQNAEALESAERGAAMEECRVEWRPDAYGLPEPDLYRVSWLTDLLLARARIAADEGDAASAGRDLVLTARMARHMLHGRGGYNAATWIVEALVSAAEDVLSQVDLPPDVAAELREYLIGLDLPEELEAATRIEVAQTLLWSEILRQHPEWIVPHSFPGSSDEERLRTVLERIGPTWPWSRFVDLARGRYVELAIENIELQKLPYRELEQRPARERGNSPVDVLVEFWLFWPGDHAKRRDRAEMSVELVLVALDLCDYRHVQGAYPETLDELPGSGAPDYALDPFSGERLSYERRDAGFWLWSIGTDLDSDDGLRYDELPRPRGQWEAGDISLRLER